MVTSALERFVIARCEEHFGTPIEHVTWQERDAWIKQVARTFDGSPDTGMAEALGAVLVKPQGPTT